MVCWCVSASFYEKKKWYALPLVLAVFFFFPLFLSFFVSVWL